eukprot:3782324-Amphidinium_carterae.2
MSDELGHGGQVAIGASIVDSPPDVETANEPAPPEYAPARRKRGRPKKAAIGQSGALVVSAPAVEASVASSSADDVGHCSLQHVGWSEPYQVFKQVTESVDAHIPPLTSHRRRLFQGHCMPPVTSSALVYCAKQAANATDFDCDIASIEGVYLSHAPFHCASLATRAKQLEIPEKTLHSKVIRLASAQLCCSRVMRHILEERMAAACPHIELLGCVEFHGYDETPMRSTVMDKKHVPDMVGPGVHDDSDHASQVALLERLAGSLKQQAVVCKILQDQQWFGFVMKRGDSYIKIVGEQATPLQVLEQNTAETISQALLQQSNSGKRCSSYKFKTLLTASDKASSNLKAEKEMVKVRGLGWSHLSFDCEIHDNSRVFNASLEPVFGEHISGIINTALSLRHSGMLASFRAALREEIKTTLVIKRGCCSPDAQRYKNLVLDVFTPGSGKSISQLMLLSVLPNGDWRDGNVVEHYVDHDVSVEAYASIASTMEAGLMLVLTSRKPTVWCRHRWTGCQVAVSELGLLTAVHNLLPRAFNKVFAAGKSGNTSLFASDPSERPPPFVAGSSTDFVVASGDNLASGADCAEASGEASASAIGEGASSSSTAPTSWAAENDAQRRKGREWLQSQPLPHLSAIAICVAPLQSLMYKQFEVAGKAWDEKQNIEALRKMEAGGCESFLARDYQVTLAAGGVLEAEFFKNLQLASTDYDKWHIIEDGCRDVAMNAKVFAIFSKSGAMIERLLAQRHKTFPIKLFSLLKNAEPAALAGTKPCMLDEFSSELLELCPGFAGPECLHILHLHAMLAWTSTARVESLHSSIRRQVVLRSVQTHTMPFPMLSAEYFLQQLRTCQQSFANMGKTGAEESRKSRNKVLLGL